MQSLRRVIIVKRVYEMKKNVLYSFLFCISC